MTSRKPKFRDILKTLEELHNLYPSYNLGRHISTAFDEDDMWAMTDESFLNTLNEYKIKFELGLKKIVEEVK